MKNNLKKFFSIFLASIVFNTSNVVHGFNGKMPNEIVSLLNHYVEKYNDNLSEDFESELVGYSWRLYIGQFSKVKKRLKALENVCNVMMTNCAKFSDPQRQRLGRILSYICQNSNYDFIIQNYRDLCPSQFCSYGVLMHNPDDTIRYLKYLLYFIRTGNQRYVEPYSYSFCPTTYITRIKIYAMFQKDIKYINEQQ